MLKAKRLWRLLIVFMLLASQALLAGDIVNGYGLLWRIQDQAGHTSYLYGTMHVADPDITSLPVEVEQAFSQSRLYVMEVIIDGKATNYMFSQMMYEEGGTTLDQVLPRKLYRKVVRAMRPYGFTNEQVDRFKPWAILLLLSAPPESDSRGQVLDMNLYQRAQGRNVPAYGLETIEEQVAVFAEGFSEAEMEILLWGALKEKTDHEKILAEMKRLYLARDLAGLARVSNEQVPEKDRAVYEKLDQRLLHDRNLRMAARIEPYAQQGGAFIAIGALHLPGEDGVVALLRHQGLQVERAY